MVALQYFMRRCITTRSLSSTDDFGVAILESKIDIAVKDSCCKISRSSYINADLAIALSINNKTSPATRSACTRRLLRPFHLAMGELIDLLPAQFEQNSAKFSRDGTHNNTHFGQKHLHAQ